MARFKLHYHLPLIGRPFLQRNQARLERDQALKERDELRNASTTAPTLYVPPGHFFSPIVDPAEADRHISQLEADSREYSFLPIQSIRLSVRI
jgi:hypothetical protein